MLASTLVKKLPLRNWHAQYGASFMDYFGWSMPASYKGVDVVTSVKHCRNRAALFDVSHMLKLKWRNPNSVDLAKGIFPTALPDGKLALSLLLRGPGIVDDCIVHANSQTGSVHTVSNASRAEDVMALLRERNVEFDIDDRVLLALQGPEASKLLSSIFSGVDKLKFMETSTVDSDIDVARCGYTGEDGFEIALPLSIAESNVLPKLLDADVTLAGLLARNFLRLEAGLNLYGQEMTEDTTPSECGMGWVLDKSRRDLDPLVLQQVSDRKALRKKRVGLIAEGRSIPLRELQRVFVGGEDIGVITSGIRSPTLRSNIALASVLPTSCKIGDKVTVQVRPERFVEAQVVKTPFVANRYIKG